MSFEDVGRGGGSGPSRARGSFGGIGGDEEGPGHGGQFTEVAFAGPESKMIQERNEDAEGLERDLEDLAECFVDVSKLVKEQGEGLDNVETQVSETKVQVDEGTRQLRRASEYNTSARWKKLLLAIIICLVIAGIVVGIVCGTGNCGGSGGSSPPAEPPANSTST